MRSLIALASRSIARAVAAPSATALRPAMPSLLARSAATPLLASRFSTSAIARQDSNPWGEVMSALDQSYEPKSSGAKVKVSYEEALEAAWAQRPLIGLPVQSDPATFGRSVRVTDNDVAGAYRIMNSVLRRNDVRRELRLQDRYEKPNQMRRRKRSERHRRRFRDLIRKRVQLVSRQSSANDE